MRSNVHIASVYRFFDQTIDRRCFFQCLVDTFIAALSPHHINTPLVIHGIASQEKLPAYNTFLGWTWPLLLGTFQCRKQCWSHQEIHKVYALFVQACYFNRCEHHCSAFDVKWKGTARGRSLLMSYRPPALGPPKFSVDATSEPSDLAGLERKKYVDVILMIRWRDIL